MIDVALDMGHGLQRHAQASDRSNEAAADHHVLCRHIAFERGALAENQRDARDVAVTSPSRWISPFDETLPVIRKSSPIVESPIFREVWVSTECRKLSGI